MDDIRYIRPIDMLGIHHLLDPELIQTMAFHYWVKDRMMYFYQLENGEKFCEAFRKASRKEKISWFAHLNGNFAGFLQEYQEETEAYFDQHYKDAIAEGTRPDNN